MIENPKHGWCDFKMGIFTGMPSYLTDVPVELLKCFISYFKSGRGMCWFDEEGTDFTLVITPYSIFIVYEKDTDVLFIIDDPPEKLASELLSDICKYRQEWIECEPSYEHWSDEKQAGRENHIGELYKELRDLLQKRGY